MPNAVDGKVPESPPLASRTVNTLPTAGVKPLVSVRSSPAHRGGAGHAQVAVRDRIADVELERSSAALGVVAFDVGRTSRTDLE